MVGQIGHVKNPLTVIAMFAGLAEVSGTAVLPLVEAETQLFYVKFLTFFPCFLVGLFFYTIWKYPTHLYAPSDYVNEDNYVLASGKALRLKLAEEDAGPTTRLPSDDDLGPHPDGEPPIEPPPSSEGNIDGESPQTGGTDDDDGHSTLPSDNNSPIIAIEPHAIAPDQRARGYLAEQVVLQNLERELNLSFRRNVSPKNSPDIVIDGLNITDNRVTLAEVRVVRGMSTVQVNKSMEAFLSVLSDMPASQRSNAKFLLAIVHPGWSSDGIQRFSDRLMASPLAKIVKPELHFFNIDHVAPEHT